MTKDKYGNIASLYAQNMCYLMKRALVFKASQEYSQHKKYAIKLGSCKAKSKAYHFGLQNSLKQPCLMYFKEIKDKVINMFREEETIMQVKVDLIL